MNTRSKIARFAAAVLAAGIALNPASAADATAKITFDSVIAADKLLVEPAMTAIGVVGTRGLDVVPGILGGALKPSYAVALLNVAPSSAGAGDQTFGGVKVAIAVEARAKVNAESALGARKILAVETTQVVEYIIIPRLEDGVLTADTRAKIKSATSKKERFAQQEMANAFRELVSKSLTSDKVKGDVSNVFLTLAGDDLPSISTIVVSSYGVELIFGVPGSGYAKYTASREAEGRLYGPSTGERHLGPSTEATLRGPADGVIGVRDRTSNGDGPRLYHDPS